MKIEPNLFAACVLGIAVASCGGPPPPLVRADDPAFVAQRRSLVNTVQRSGPMSTSSIPGDHVLKRAMIEPWRPALFTQEPTACVVAVHQTPRGEEFASVLVQKREDKIRLTWEAGRGRHPSCIPQLATLQPYPELEQDLRRLMFRGASYCEQRGGGAAVVGSNWQCRYDGLKGFPSNR
jgi:hypothetical protein